MKAFTPKQIHILAVAEELISQKGFDHTSVREISDKAKINVAMISYYFGSKGKMMSTLYLYRVQKTQEVFLEFLTKIEKDKPEIQLHKIIDFIVEQLMKYHYFHQFVTQELKFTDEVNHIMLDFYKNLVLVIDHVMQRGFSEKRFTRLVKPEDIVSSLLGTIFFSIRNRNFYEQYLDPNQKFLSAIQLKLKKHLQIMVFSLLGFKK